jgi:NAD(P)-dependent dehydrogenase (short-subunit alcohol dehydrogenase family)
MLMTNSGVLVVVGAGGIGQAIARRQGAGKAILLADLNEDTLDAAAHVLEDFGYAVNTQRVDIASRASVHALADKAAQLGPVVQVVNTAGLSPVQASPEAILAVDLVGTALFLEEFGAVVAEGGAGIVISSMAGHMMPALEPSQDELLSNTPTDELLQLPLLGSTTIPNSGAAYAMAKRANQLRVRSAAVLWGDRGARVNSISPGIILTPLAKEEMSGPGAAGYQAMIEKSAAGRVGTTDEVASVAAFLLGSDAAFITGADLLMDGGVIAALRAGRLQVNVG